MNKFILALIITGSLFSISCDKDVVEKEKEKEKEFKIIDNVDAQFAIDYKFDDKESKDTFFIEYFIGKNLDIKFDTIINQNSWKSPVIKSNSSDSIYCSVIIHSVSKKVIEKPSLDIKFSTIDQTIQISDTNRFTEYEYIRDSINGNILYNSTGIEHSKVTFKKKS